MRLVVPLLVSLGFSLACAGLGGGDDAGDEGSGNGGMDTDTTDAGGRCGPYSAIADGRWWTYDYAGNGMTGTWTTTVSAFDGTSGTLTMEADYEGDSYAQHLTSTTWFTCDGGVVTQRVETAYDGESSGYEFSGASVTTYTDPQAYLPPALAVGDTWTVRYRGTTEAEGTAPYDFDFSTTYVVEEQDSIEVEAGTWTSLFVGGETDGEQGGGQWVARGVGGIAGDGYELVDWSE